MDSNMCCTVREGECTYIRKCTYRIRGVDDQVWEVDSSVHFASQSKMEAEGGCVVIGLSTWSMKGAIQRVREYCRMGHEAADIN